ncbi:PepSY domain-containing protein [Priestia megaterium]|uniref:PepSY domain-containing protein n=1 Tax=Priestia megaterium TaxID=1404 RepID=UPI0021D6990C|nr:PepSY domain-containing protein [Priestia megaterium]MCU7741291.1 PepSY domain-containing protein [Priestia megaterium]MCU7746650.1 PepSY domain-containing protein [Priestia megaterium]
MNKKLCSKVIVAMLTLFAIGFSTIQTGYAASSVREGFSLKGDSIVQRAISEEQAKTIALKQVQGRVIHVDLDSDDGVMKYEVLIMTDKNQIYEVEINANTGAVIKVEQEND